MVRFVERLDLSAWFFFFSAILADERTKIFLGSWLDSVVDISTGLGRLEEASFVLYGNRLAARLYGSDFRLNRCRSSLSPLQQEGRREWRRERIQRRIPVSCRTLAHRKFHLARCVLSICYGSRYGARLRSCPAPALRHLLFKRDP